MAKSDSEIPQAKLNEAHQEIKRGYWEHQKNAIDQVSGLVKAKIEQGKSYEAFTISMGLYVLAYLVNQSLSEPSNPIVELVQESFKSALK